MEKQKLRAGVIGVGKMGQFHANLYGELKGVELAGVSDLDEERLALVAEKFGVKGYADYKEMLQHIDLATIAVPTELHYDVAKTALLAGKHLLVEKPVCDSYEKAQELFAIAEERGLVLHVGHVERFNGAVQELHSLLADEEPILLQSRRMGPYDPRVAAAGVVMDLMIHDIDIILNLVKSPLIGLNVMGSVVHSERDDVVVVQMMFKSGAMATITASRVTQNKIRTMSISCKSKYMEMDFSDQEITVHRLAASEHQLGQKELKYKELEQRERIFVHRDNPLKLELQHLVDCIRGDCHSHVSIGIELESLRVALAIVEKFQAFKAECDSKR